MIYAKYHLRHSKTGVFLDRTARNVDDSTCNIDVNVSPDATLNLLEPRPKKVLLWKGHPVFLTALDKFVALRASFLAKATRPSIEDHLHAPSKPWHARILKVLLKADVVKKDEL